MHSLYFSKIESLSENRIMKSYNILIVDDEERVRRVLVDLLELQGYSTRQAENGYHALELISQSIPDLVISDIHMPDMDGFKLFGILDKSYPGVKQVLMTSYDVDKYISLIRKYNIGNILIKGAELNLNEVSRYLKSILTGDIFGLEKYFSGTEMKKVSLFRYSDAKRVSHEIVQEIPQKQQTYLEVAIDELVSNAFFHGVLQLTGIPRELWRDDYEIDPQSAITVVWTRDSEKVGVAIEDPKGNLKKIDVLKWLDSCRDEQLGLEHGRGLMLVRKLIDRMVINIDPGKRTECIIIQYLDRDLNTNNNKPLMVHEL